MFKLLEKLPSKFSLCLWRDDPFVPVKIIEPILGEKICRQCAIVGFARALEKMESTCPEFLFILE